MPVRITVALAVIGCCPGGARADARAEQAMARGAAFLRGQIANAAPGERSLAAYALLKAGEPADSTVIAQAVRQILERTPSSGYRPDATAVYTAAVDLMVLEAADRDRHHQAIQTIANYLISRQNANGSWDYTTSTAVQCGDTSQTQYALLGLWAAVRAGVEVPPRVWDAAARWHIATQRPDGAWTYHPFDLGDPKHSMTAAGTGSLSLIRRMLYASAPRAAPRKVAAPAPAATPATPTIDRRYRFLEHIDSGERGVKSAPPAAAAPRPAGSAPKVSAGDIDAAIDRGLGWLAKNFQIHTPNVYPFYYLYGLERLGALADAPLIGMHDWYAEGTHLLIGLQAPNGQWAGQVGAVPSTSFGVLFLSKATAKLLETGGGPRRRFGTGLLAGGRGLPDDLTRVQIQGGEVKVARQTGPLNDLLVALESAPEAKVVATQSAIIDAVQLGDPEQLIGQTDRLLRLADDPRPEVRRTALWALGHTGHLPTAPRLIRALNDPNLDVNVDAYNALCTLSRRPAGVGLPESPVEGIPDDAPAAARTQAIARWRSEAVTRWQEWYRQVRPYDERDNLPRNSTEEPIR